MQTCFHRTEFRNPADALDCFVNVKHHRTEPGHQARLYTIYFISLNSVVEGTIDTLHVSTFAVQTNANSSSAFAAWHNSTSVFERIQT